MSTNSESPSNDLTTVQQRRQANIFLLRLQWLLILLLLAALTWLYVSQKSFENGIDERLKSNEQVISRLNEMDDRLFAMSQHTLPEPSANISSQAQNQLDLLRIQIQAVDRLLADNKDAAAIELLRGLHWQLSQSGNEIAPALTVVIKQGLTKDIERLQAQSAQISPWQVQSLAIQNIQEFLHSHERNEGHERNDGHERNEEHERNVNATSSQPSAASSNLNNTKPLTRRQLMIHEVIMTLNLATQASNMRESEQLTGYLRQARTQLKTLPPTSADTNNKNATATSSKNSPKTTQDQIILRNNLETLAAPTNVSEVIDWLDQLIANAPTATPLLTTQILNQQ